MLRGCLQDFQLWIILSTDKVQELYIHGKFSDVATIMPAVDSPGWHVQLPKRNMSSVFNFEKYVFILAYVSSSWVSLSFAMRQLWDLLMNLSHQDKNKE